MADRHLVGGHKYPVRLFEQVAGWLLPGFASTEPAAETDLHLFLLSLDGLGTRQLNHPQMAATSCGHKLTGTKATSS